ncbi:alanine--glyoxylate aminotransferase family protein [Patescibacteria group bacterium]|nr:alanine--glyoxylate aminotransferase family protein [Patescibacteria group bacterium]MCL5798395.1 alanine--glyoxylate aminotransferase family protein [Patescibacteria group bacterium]
MKVHTETNLRIPGPTPLPTEVLEATSRQMINHRGHQYEEMQARITANLQHFFQTKNDIFLLTSSGMGGLEAAIVNFFSPEDKIVAFTCGEFGNRFAEVARRFWATVEQVQFPPGQPVSKDEVFSVLEKIKDVKGVLFTHNETSSGVLNDVASFAPIVKTHPNKPLLIIDSISALGAVDLPMDSLDIDVVVSASQKAWMAPPGLSMIAVSSYAWERHEFAKMPRYYFDLSMFKEFAAKNQTPATPAVPALFGLDMSLQLMKKEGRENIYKRHLELMNYFREGVAKLGLELFVHDSHASPTLTSIIVPDEIDAKQWIDIMRTKYNTVIAGGMGETKGKIIRVAHMGNVDRRDLDEVLEGLKRSLPEVKKYV